MLRIVLQRFADKRSIAELLEAVPLDEVLRRMQSSSLTNPARSLEAHFVFADQTDGASPSTSLPAFSSAQKKPSGVLLRNALSERLLAEVRLDINNPHLGLDSGSLMLANCLRHQLSPLATHQVFALWLKFMQQGVIYGTSPASSTLGSLSMLRLSRSSGGGSAQGRQLLQFQSLVRVLEACLDAQEQQRQLPFRTAGEGGKIHAPSGTTTMLQHQNNLVTNPVCFTLDDWAGLIDTVEQYWPLFTDYGASTAGLLVQFTALALELTGSASSTPVAAEPGSRFANSLRFLSQLQTDRTLLQTRVYALCGEAVKTLCALENADHEEARAESSWRRAGPWWHRPQELVRLSQARRRIEAYESGQLCGPDTDSKTTSNNNTRNLYSLKSDSVHHSSSDGSVTRASANAPVRGTRVGSHNCPSSLSSLADSTMASTTTISSPRWMPRLSNAWWPSSASSALSGGCGASGCRVAASRSPNAAPRVGKQLGGYVTFYALQHTSTAARRTDLHSNIDRSSREEHRLSTYSSNIKVKNAAFAARLPASVSVAIKDVLEIFETVCSTAVSSDALAYVTTFSWWMRDVILHQYGRRSLHNMTEMASLLGIAGLCLAYPDGTQTVLAEILKCIQRSALFLWQVGELDGASDFAAASLTAPVAAFTLWSRACAIVADALPLTTVRLEADRTLRALVSTAQQAMSTPRKEASEQLLLRHRRYGVLILGCLLLQRPDGYVTPSFSARIRELVVTVPFLCVTGEPNELASAVRALYIFTHPGNSSSRDNGNYAAQQMDEVVYYLLNQVSQLLTLSREAGVSKADNKSKAAPSRTLSLSTTERQLLRSALLEIRTNAADEIGVSMLAKVVLDNTSRERDQTRAVGAGEANSTASRERLALSRKRESAELPTTSDTFSVMSSGDCPSPSAARASIATSQQCVRGTSVNAKHDPQPNDHNEQLLQREVEGVSRHFAERRSTL